MNRQQIVDALWPLVDRCHLGHCWIKTKNGPRRIDDPFTPVSLNEHATGSNVYGLCPIAPGSNTTRVACLDLDSHKGETPWQEMRNVADTVCMLLEEEGMAPTMFRSSGGSGIHVYLVWDEPQDAHSVREFLRDILRQCGFKAGTKGVAGKEIEVFPKQSEVPTDGYGSMFILPLSKGTKSELLSGELWEMSTPVPVVTREPRTSTTVPEVSTDLVRLKSALDAIPNTGEKELDYDNWRNCIFAIHFATDGSDEGLALAESFSSKSSKFDADFLRGRVWPYVRSEREGATITDRSLYALAAAEGWEDPDVLAGFDVITDSAADAALEPGAGGAVRFKFVPDEEFTEGAPLQWIIKGVLPKAQVGVIYGESGSGKSFLALDMAGCIARGLNWREKNTQQLKVGYIAAEGAAGFKNRLRAYRSHNNVKSLGMQVLAGAPQFTKREDVVDLGHAMKGIDVLFVDTLAQVTSGADENSGEAMGRVLGHCRTLSDVTGAMVVLIAHSGKDPTKGLRGWSGLKAALDIEIEVTRADNDRKMTLTKVKDGPGEGDAYGFKLLQVPIGTDEDGDVITSCVVEATEVAHSMSRQRVGSREQLLLTCLKDLTAPDGGGPMTEELITAAVNQMGFDHGSGKRDTRRQHALRALETLQGKGLVAFEGGRVLQAGAE